MIFYPRSDVITLSVTVAGNTGSTSFSMAGSAIIRNISIQPGQVSSYDYDLSDSSGYGIAGQTGLSGKVALAMDEPCKGTNTLTLANATNGTYSIRLFVIVGV